MEEEEESEISLQQLSVRFVFQTAFSMQSYKKAVLDQKLALC